MEMDFGLNLHLQDEANLIQKIEEQILAHRGEDQRLSDENVRRLSRAIIMEILALPDPESHNRQRVCGRGKTSVANLPHDPSRSSPGIKRLIGHHHKRMLKFMDGSSVQQPGLTLEAALKCNHAEVVKALLPVGTFEVPFNALSLENNLSKILFTRHTQVKSYWLPQENRAMDIAAQNGNLALIEWLQHYDEFIVHNKRKFKPFAKGTQWATSLIEKICTTRAMAFAAQGGHLAVVEWLHANRTEGCTGQALGLAAGSGHLTVAKWLATHYPEQRAECYIDNNALKAAGQALFVEWGQAHFAGVHHPPAVLAAANGYLHVCEWLAAAEGVPANPAGVWAAAAANARWPVLNWLRTRAAAETEAKGMEGNAKLWGSTRTADLAAAAGHLAVCEWLLPAAVEAGHQARWSRWAMDGASQRGHLSVVEWLHAQGEPTVAGCTRAAMDRAAENGHLHVVEWLAANRNEGCSPEGVDRACAAGRLPVVEFLFSRYGEPSPAAINQACRGGKLAAVEWLAPRAEAFEEGVADRELDDLRVMEWLHARRPALFRRARVHWSALRAAQRGDAPALRWLVAWMRAEGLGAPVVRTTLQGAMQEAAQGGHLAVVEWLTGEGAAGLELFNWAAEGVRVAFQAGNFEIVQHLCPFVMGHLFSDASKVVEKHAAV